MYRLPIIVFIYCALMAFCAFGVEHFPRSTQIALWPYIWVVGPPANLVYGTHFLTTFFIGTGVVGLLGFGVVRSKSKVAKAIWGIGFLLAWALFGVIAYAPVA